MYDRIATQKSGATESTAMDIEATDADKTLASSAPPLHEYESAVTATGGRFSTPASALAARISTYQPMSFAPPPPPPVTAGAYGHERSNLRPHLSTSPHQIGYYGAVPPAVLWAGHRQSALATTTASDQVFCFAPDSDTATSVYEPFYFAPPPLRPRASPPPQDLEYERNDSLQYPSSRASDLQQLKTLFRGIQGLEDLDSSIFGLNAMPARTQPQHQDEEAAMPAPREPAFSSGQHYTDPPVRTSTPRTSSRTPELFEDTYHSMGLISTHKTSQDSQLDPSFHLEDCDNVYSNRYTFETASSFGTDARPLHKIKVSPPQRQIGESRTNPDAKGLLDLPAELRNHIYELAFTTGPPTKPKTDLHEALAPVNKELLFTCHQIYNEAVHFYRSAYKSYWLETPFILDHETNNLTPGEIALISRLAYDDLQHVRHLEISASDSESFVLVDACGIWEKTTTDNDTGAVTGEDWIVPCGNYWEVEAKTWDNEESAWEQCSQRDFPRLPVSDQVRFLWEVYGF